jgi:hypothetical protein
MSDAAVALESVVEQAWRDFREAFADALEALDPGDWIKVRLDAGDDTGLAAPCIQALHSGQAIVLEVSSNTLLSTGQKLSRKGQAHLRRLGLITPTRELPYYWATYPLSHVDQAANVAVSGSETRSASCIRRSCTATSRVADGVKAADDRGQPAAVGGGTSG